MGSPQTKSKHTYGYSTSVDKKYDESRMKKGELRKSSLLDVLVEGIEKKEKKPIRKDLMEYEIPEDDIEMNNPDKEKVYDPHNKTWLRQRKLTSKQIDDLEEDGLEEEVSRLDPNGEARTDKKGNTKYIRTTNVEEDDDLNTKNRFRKVKEKEEEDIDEDEVDGNPMLSAKKKEQKFQSPQKSLLKSLYEMLGG